MTKFLSKLGQILSKGLQIAATVGGIAGPFLPAKVQQIEKTVVNDFEAIGGIVTMTEAILGAGNGANKLAKATPLVASYVRSAELLVGKKVADEALFIQGCQKLTDGMADVLNSLHSDAAKEA